MLVFGSVTVKKCEQFSSTEYDSLSVRMIVPNCEVSISHDAVSARPLASEELSGVDHEKCQQCMFFCFCFLPAALGFYNYLVFYFVLFV